MFIAGRLRNREQGLAFATSYEWAKDFTRNPVYILSVAQANTHKNSANMPSFVTGKHNKISARKAFARAGINPEEIDVAEIHDWFTIPEVISLFEP